MVQGCGTFSGPPSAQGKGNIGMSWGKNKTKNCAWASCDSQPPAPESDVGKGVDTEARSLVPQEDPQSPALPLALEHPALLARLRSRELTAPQGNLLCSQPEGLYR